jgi:hypothetical protein
MHYMLSIFVDTEAGAGADMSEWMAYGEAAQAGGVLVSGAGLQPPSTATTVRLRGGERLLTDGPFAETKEQLGGFYILDCKDLDEAVELAAKIPAAQHGSVEVRPIWEVR